MDGVNLDSIVKQGRLPWRPNAQASGLEVWHEYETPLTGTFTMGSSMVLFTLVLETDSEISIWGYVELPEEVSDTIGELSFGDVDALNSWVEDQFSKREAVLAFAKQSRLAGRWGRKVVKDNLLGALESLLEDFINSVDEVRDPTTRIKAKVAGVAAARYELPSRSTLVDA